MTSVTQWEKLNVTKLLQNLPLGERRSRWSDPCSKFLLKIIFLRIVVFFYFPINLTDPFKMAHNGCKNL